MWLKRPKDRRDVSSSYHNMEIGYRRYDADRKSTVSAQLARDPSASITKQFQRHVTAEITRPYAVGRGSNNEVVKYKQDR